MAELKQVPAQLNIEYWVNNELPYVLTFENFDFTGVVFTPMLSISGKSVEIPFIVSPASHQIHLTFPKIEEEGVHSWYLEIQRNDYTRTILIGRVTVNG